MVLLSRFTDKQKRVQSFSWFGESFGTPWYAPERLVGVYNFPKSESFLPVARLCTLSARMS